MRNPRQRLWAAVIFIAGTSVFLLVSRPNPHANKYGRSPSLLYRTKPHRTTLRSQLLQVTTVVASQKAENATWLQAAFPQWDHNVYVTDDHDAPLTVPLNKGREGMVYLTYIIDNYEHLPPIILFHHSQRYQWHADDPLYDGQRILQRLQLPFVAEQGYVNLRCVWTLGCPVEIYPFDEIGGAVPSSPDEEQTGAVFRAAFEELFPEYSVPDEVGVSCCAQFAVTNWKVRERPKEDYERYREWLIHTDLSDDLSGRILEYVWHIIFGQPSIFCPDAEACYCNVFGLCDLTCEEQGQYDSQYILPDSPLLPDGWPEYGWDGEWQDITEM